MSRIAISPTAFDAITQNTPIGSVTDEAESTTNDERVI
jgi:hypothetical protein